MPTSFTLMDRIAARVEINRNRERPVGRHRTPVVGDVIDPAYLGIQTRVWRAVLESRMAHPCFKGCYYGTCGMSGAGSEACGGCCSCLGGCVVDDEDDQTKANGPLPAPITEG